ncbi:MAG: phosphotransferase [Porticoccaceae bacterium]
MELRGWVEQFLPAHAAPESPLALQPIAGDAGFRKYFRVNSRPPLIAVFAPPDRENTPAFVAKDLALCAGGVVVPRIYAVNYDQGFMLQEDLGDQLLLTLLTADNMPSLYDLAEAALVRLQQVAPHGDLFEPYDRKLLLDEMALFTEWFVEKMLAQVPTAEERELIDDTFAILAASALEQPQVVVHRDYHSRNLILTADGEIGTVDFQDGVIGPFTYDLVSLLKDCYIRRPASIVKERALAFLTARADELGVRNARAEQLLQWFDFMGLQRHIKVLGIFARLWLRDGKARYLEDLPLVLRYTLEVSAQYPQLAPFNEWFAKRLLPLLPDQPWYRDWQLAGEQTP